MSDPAPRLQMDLTKNIFDLITIGGYGRERLCKEFGIQESMAREWLAVAKYLQKNNMPFIDDPLHKPSGGAVNYEIKGDWWKVAVVSDLHVGSNVFREEPLIAFIKYALDNGVETFLFPGDILDGTKVYKGQEYEQNIPGIDGQIKYFTQMFPQIPKAFFITGNHEYSAFKNIGKDIGQDISRERKEFQYLGCMEGRININGVPIELYHPQGSGAYALSYKLQKRIESYVPGDKPRILLVGHYHQSMEMTIRNVTGYMCGSWQGPNTFSRALNLTNVTGGWILEILSSDGEVKSIKSEFIQTY